MTAIADLAFCSHCLLPAGRLATRRDVDGEPHAFCCYGCYLAYRVRHGRAEESEAAWLLIRLGVGGFLTMNLMLFTLLDYSRVLEQSEPELRPAVHVLLWALATGVWAVLGGPLLRECWRDLRGGRLGATALICLGSGAAYAYSALSVVSGGPNVYFDVAAALLLLFTLGRLLEAAGRARAVRSLAPMLEAERQWATVARADGEERLPVAALQPGTMVVVRPGERIAVDGVVVAGRSLVDEAVLTGEAHPTVKEPGSPVFAGSLNRDGVLSLRMTVAAGDSRWARICRTVRATLGEETPLRRLADRVAGLFVPAVLALALGTALYRGGDMPFEPVLMTALAVLVVACPCALGLAAPLALTLGIGRLAGGGCLVRGGRVMEELARVRTVAFDKTGTLTAGGGQVVAVAAFDAGEDDVLRRAAALERQGGHVLGASIVAAACLRGVGHATAEAVRLVPGCGVTGMVAGAETAVGRADWLSQNGWSPPAAPEAWADLDEGGATIVHVGWDGRIRGAIAIEARPRPDAAAMIRNLHDLGIRTVLLTGDRPAAAKRLAGLVGIDVWQADLSPEDKVSALAGLRRAGPVAMVGDGLNDGPVLAQACVGIAVADATDMARETAGLVLPEGGLRLLPWAIRLARTVSRTIVVNLAWAFGYNLIALTLAILGLLPPILAAALMATSSLVVVLNSLRVESAWRQ